MGFYQNDNERELKLVVDYIYNNYVGGEENHYLDCDERYFNFTEESLIEQIYSEITKKNDKGYFWVDCGLVVEAKHIRFIGKKRIKEIVEHRVKYRHAKEGWIFENCDKVFKL